MTRRSFVMRSNIFKLSRSFRYDLPGIESAQTVRLSIASTFYKRLLLVRFLVYEILEYIRIVVQQSLARNRNCHICKTLSKGPALGWFSEVRAVCVGETILTLANRRLQVVCLSNGKRNRPAKRLNNKLWLSVPSAVMTNLIKKTSLPAVMGTAFVSAAFVGKSRGNRSH